MISHLWNDCSDCKGKIDQLQIYISVDRSTCHSQTRCIYHFEIHLIHTHTSHTSHVYICTYIYMIYDMHAMSTNIAHRVHTICAMFADTVNVFVSHTCTDTYAHVWVSTKRPLQDNLCHVMLFYKTLGHVHTMCAVCAYACVQSVRAYTWSVRIHTCAVCIHIVCSVCIHVCGRSLQTMCICTCLQ